MAIRVMVDLMIQLSRMKIAEPMIATSIEW